jgi:hypothetical protein
MRQELRLPTLLEHCHEIKLMLHLGDALLIEIMFVIFDVTFNVPPAPHAF